MTGRAWLVTGASGFLGRHLLGTLGETLPDQRTIALVRSPDEWQRMSWTRDLPAVDTVVGGVTAPERWGASDKLAGLGGIFHLAALVRHHRAGSEEVYFVNVEGTRAMVRIAARYRCRLVFVSTSGTVGCFKNAGETADEDSPYCEREVARWPYYDSKVQAEKEARRLAQELGVELVIVRPPVLLGPLDHRYRSSNHVARFLHGKLPFLIRGGMHFADVRDAAAALVAVMRRPDVRPVYHLPGTVTSIGSFYGMVADAAGMPLPRRVIPYLPALWASRLLHAAGIRVLPEPALIEMASHYWAMESKWSAAELGYRSRPGAETVRDTVAWLREAGVHG